MNISNLQAYELLKQEKLTDIQSEGYILRHKKSGARIVLVSNDDDNKVFFIGFRTTPENETGVPHITEHTVLCGSDKFPAKDPFIELVKGSLNTFLNALTYPDKTMYPVASCNDKDFQNLMDVYMDAVLHPNIYKHEEIFKQEGWHYELLDEDSPLTINGVVYNEMKGAYSAVDELITNEVSKALFPDNIYKNDSGGNPDDIPKLSYEEFLDFHRTYYSPANSYIYLYGDMDMEEKLNWLDQEYLSHYEKVEVHSEIPMQKSFDEVKDITITYPISSEEEEEDNTYLSYNVVVGTALDKELYQAFDILDYALLSAPGAPIKKALLEAEIGMDISGGFDSGLLQPVFSIDAKNANPEDKDKFLSIIRKCLEDAVKDGVDRQALLAAINSNEFRFREADFGRYPKGLLYGLQMMDSWLFDDMAPFLHIQCLDTYAFLKEQLETDYYEKLIEKYLINNKHAALLTMIPEKGLAKKKEEELERKLAEYKASLSKDEILKIVADTKALKEYQEEASSKEDLEKIPMLGREDIRKEISPFSNIEAEIDGIKVVRHAEETNGIDYMTFLFDARDVKQEDLSYLGILKAVLSYVDTDTISYGDLSNIINIYTGGMNSTIDTYVSNEGSHDFKVYYSVNVKVLEENLPKAMEIFMDFLLHSKLEDEKRVREIISQMKSRKQQSLSSGGNTTSYIRAMSGFSKTGYYMDAINGIRAYRMVDGIERDFEGQKKQLFLKLKELCQKLFTRERLLISFTGSDNAFASAKDILPAYLKELPSREEEILTADIKLQPKNEAFTDASQIQYVAKVGNYRKYGYDYCGQLMVLKNILTYDYLWTQVRMLGGAYACQNVYYRTGETIFTSYRDPNLSKTLENYDAVVDYIRNFNPDERDMTKYIIGAFASGDTPLNPEAKGSRALAIYLTDNNANRLQKERDQVLATYAEDIRALADLVEAALKDAVVCVIGNEEMIHKESDLFEQVEGLC